MTTTPGAEHDEAIAAALEASDLWHEPLKVVAELRAQLTARGLVIAPATGAGFEPKGCPTPGACSCLPGAGFAAGMRRAAEIARQRAMYLSLKEDYGDEVIQARHEGSSDELRSIADAILAPFPSAPPAGDSDVTVPKWRPIETAPKDGSVMLAYNGDIFLMVLWVSTGCWQEWSSREPYDNYRPLTHWMSLRDLPDPDDDNSLATLPSAPPASEGE